MKVSSRQHVGRMIVELVSLVDTCAVLEDLDRRRTLLDIAGRLIDALGALVGDLRETGDGSIQVLALLRNVTERQRILAGEVEQALRVRSMRQSSARLVR